VLAALLGATATACAQSNASAFRSWDVGAMFGAVQTRSTAVESTSGFYQGAFDAFVTPYVGVFATTNVATYGRSPAPFGSWVLSVGPIADVMVLGKLKFDGTAGGLPVQSTGSMTQADFLGALKLTTALNREYNLSFFGAAGVAARWPDGNPTGLGGPRIIGSDTAGTYRLGVELSRATRRDVNFGWTFAYQRTEAMRFDSTLAGGQGCLCENEPL